MLFRSIIVDGVVFEASYLEVDESLLTGESDALLKQPGDEVMSGSFVVSGVGAYRATRVGLESYAAKLTVEASKFSLVKSELGDIMKVTGSSVYSRINRWSKAIPQYNLGYHKVVQAIENCEKRHSGLFFCSNYRGGIAVGDCVMSGDKAATEVQAYLNSNRSVQQHSMA